MKAIRFIGRWADGWVWNEASSSYWNHRFAEKLIRVINQSTQAVSLHVSFFSLPFFYCWTKLIGLLVRRQCFDFAPRDELYTFAAAADKSNSNLFNLCAWRNCFPFCSPSKKQPNENWYFSEDASFLPRHTARGKNSIRKKEHTCLLQRLMCLISKVCLYLPWVSFGKEEEVCSEVYTFQIYISMGIYQLDEASFFLTKWNKNYFASTLKWPAVRARSTSKSLGAHPLLILLGHKVYILAAALYSAAWATWRYKIVVHVCVCVWESGAYTKAHIQYPQPDRPAAAQTLVQRS